MFWVLQKNLFNETAFADLLVQLERQKTEYEIVNIIPFIHLMSPDVNPVGPVYVNGSTGIGKIAKAKGWTPGYFDKNLDYVNLIANWGSDCLNADGYFTTLRCPPEIEFDRFFIRPSADNKSFSGMVMSKEEFHTWRLQVIALENGENSLTTLKPDDLIFISPIKQLYSETRFFVVNGEIVTGSRYKLGNKIFYSSDFDPSVFSFAKQMLNHWQPDKAFCLDIAETEDGPKIIETNSINSSGFYACDMGKYVNAINNMEY